MKGEYLLRFLGERRVFLNGEPGPDQTRVVIAEGEDPETREVVTIKGEAEEGALRVGLIYRLFGRFVSHHKYGDQFHFTATVLETPADQQSIVAYLTSIKSPMLGAVTAKRIFEAYGNDAIKTLIDEPAKVAAAIPRFSLQNATEAADKLRGKERTRRTTVDLMGLLHGRGLPKKTVEKLIDDYGSEAAAIVRRNPYCLMNYRGCGFLKADRLYMELASQHPPHVALKMAARLKRQALCCWYAIARGSDGHTWYPQAIARNAVAKEISGQDVKFDKAVRLAIKVGMLEERCEMGTRYLAEGKKARAERDIARCLVMAEQETERLGGTCWPSLEGLGLKEHQQEEAEKALQGIIGVFGGAPGTGKTWSSARIAAAIIQIHGREKIAVCAPTGKAAVRVTEAMQSSGIDLSATTIHSLLLVQSSGDDWGFEYDEKKPLPLSYILVDEASMLDAPLMAALLKARPKGCHILFIGDINQLAPVGHGAPLRDMIAAGIPYGELTKIERNWGRIVQACADIRDKRKFIPSPALDLAKGENLVLIERETPEEQIDTLQKMLQQFVDASPRKYDPVWDVQILCAVNAKSPLGRKPLNKQLQELLNFEGQRVEGNPFRVADKVINTKNGMVPRVDQQEESFTCPKCQCEQGKWDSSRCTLKCSCGHEWRSDEPDDIRPSPKEQPPFDTYFGDLSADLGSLSDEDATEQKQDKDPNAGKVRVANGEQAEVLQVEPNKMTCRMNSPDRLILIPRGTSKDKNENEAAKVEGDEEEGNEVEEKSTGTGCNWELAYAISGHKSQGSEWKLVIIMADEHNSARRVQSRNWIFTAISRAKMACWIIGKKSVVDEMCKRDGLWRKTFLVEIIRELRGPSPVKVNSSGVNGSHTNGTQTDLCETREPQNNLWSEEFCRDLLAGAAT